MMGLLKTAIRKVLFLNQKPRKFVPVSLDPAAIEETVTLITGTSEIDISQRHCVVCHQPFMIAVALPKGQLDVQLRAARIGIRKNGAMMASVDGIFRKNVGIGSNEVFVLEATSSKCYQLSSIHQYVLLKRYFLRNKKDTYMEGKMYSAVYSFPRRVVAVSYRDNEYVNIFPMDFQCAIDNELHLFGLRTTNVTLGKILAAKKLVVSDTDGADIQVIYALGRNHSATPPSLEALPFATNESDLFRFPVPAFSSSYREIEIQHTENLGTHAIMIGRIVNMRQLRPGSAPIHHVHFFEFARSSYENLLD